MKTFCRRFVTVLRSFWAARNAVAAVEFAIVVPVALMIYVGAAEVADGVMTSRKVSLVTRTLVDLTSQQATSTQILSTPTPSNALTAATLSSLMTSSQMLLSPEPLGSLTMTLTAVDVSNTLLGVCCVATVRWSYTQNGTLRPCRPFITAAPVGTAPTATTVPTQLLPTNTPLPQTVSYIIADVSYTYQPIMNTNLLNFAPAMQRTEYMMPRTVGQVVTGALPSTGTQHGLVCY